MPKARHRITSIFAAVLAIVLGLPQPVSAVPFNDTAILRAGLTQLSAKLAEDPSARTQPLADLFATYGLGAYVPSGLARPPASIAGPTRLADAELVDYRPVIALLSQGRSGEDNKAVLTAQGPDGPMAIAFRNGLVTAEHLRETLESFTEQAGPDGVVRIPVIFWEDTLLRLGPGETLTLSRTDGAFVVSLGQVEIIGSEIDVTGDRNPYSPEFRPFLSIIGGGQLTIRDASLRGLGFGWTDKFAGVTVLRHPFMAPQGPSRIIGTRIERLVSVVLDGTPDVEIANNRFHDMRGNAVRIGLAPDARIVGNLFSGSSTTNAIRVLDKSNGALVADNVLLAGTRVGILVNGGSAYVTVQGNVLWRRNGGGIKFKDTSCGLAADNLILDNRQKGIEIYASPGIRVLRNRIEGNTSAALWISGQPKTSVTHIAGNVLRGNGTGLSTATAAKLWLDANDFSAQMPRLVGGDISIRNNAIVRDLRGKTPMLLSAVEARPEMPRPVGDCGPQEDW